jgi:hypothetical protein
MTAFITLCWMKQQQFWMDRANFTTQADGMDKVQVLGFNRRDKTCSTTPRRKQ